MLGDPRLRARYDQTGKASSSAARAEELDEVGAVLVWFLALIAIACTPIYENMDA